MPHVDERQRRVVAGTTASVLGRGGLIPVSEATGMSRSTLGDAIAEVEAGVEPTTRVRRPGAGRKKLVDTDPGRLQALDDLVEPLARGDAMSPLRWTSKSRVTLAKELTAQGHPVSPTKVGQLLKDLQYSLQAPAKENEGSQHEDRDAQFSYINDAAKAHLAEGQPVISVDTKKKECLGNLANKGKEYQPNGNPERVAVHDFPDPALGKAIPFGVYYINPNQRFALAAHDHTPSTSTIPPPH